MSWSPATPRYLRFGRFTLDLARECLRTPDEEIRLRPKTLAVLRVLVQHPGTLVERDQLMADVWGDVVVTEASLSQCVAEIRQALGDTDHSMIRTVPRRGYILDVPVAKGGRRVTPASSWRWAPVAAVVLLAITAGVTVLSWPRDESVQPALTVQSSTEAAAYGERGRYFYQRRAPGDLERAREQFERAVTLDPDHVDAWAGLAAIAFIDYRRGPANQQVLDRLEHATNRALALDPENGRVLIRAARLEELRGNWRRARRLHQRALAAGPEDPVVLSVHAGKAMMDLQFQQAVALQERAIGANPIDRAGVGNLAWYHLLAGDYRSALDGFEDAARLALDQGADDAAGVALANALIGRHGAAAAAIAEIAEPATSFARMVGLVVDAQREGADAVAESLARLEVSSDARDLLVAAALHAYLGNDHAARQLMSAADGLVAESAPSRYYEELEELLTSPLFVNLRGDPVFTRLYTTWRNTLRASLEFRYAVLAQR